MIHVFQDKTVKTRKPHHCWGCGDAISVGDKALYRVQVDDGFSHSYWCIPCNNFPWPRDWMDGDGISQGEMWEFDGYKEYREATA